VIRNKSNPVHLPVFRNCPQRLARRLITAALLLPALLHAADEPDYRNPQAPLEQRVNSLFQAMTPEERITLVSGDGHMSTKSIPRLGVPAMTTADATQGVRGGSHTTDGSATLFTSGVLMASTWDLDLASQIGQGVGTEALNKGTGSQILLGPGVNILRTPFGGRTGEYLGGEDPYVASRMAVAYITGLQQTGCAACVKHYACNNQEFMRGGIDVRVSERALREIYTPAFIAAVKEGHVWSVMSAYNQVNGVYCSGNWYLQKEILDHEAGFDGIIMSDWGGVHDTLALNDGCDLAMPGHGVFEPQLVSAALQSGDLLQANVDDAVKRVIRTIIRVGLLDKTRVPDPAQINTPEHQHLALEAAEKGMVLLKNAQNILPLDTNKIHSIALIGPACKQWQMGTRGSAYVKPVQSVSAYDGIVARAGSGIDISFNEGYDENYTGEPVPTSALTADADHGLMGEYFAGTDFSHPPVSTHLDPNLDFYFTAAQLRSLGIKHDQFCARWTGTLTAPATGTFRMSLNSPLDKSGGRLFIDDKLVQDVWPGFNGDQIAGQIDLVEGQTYKVRIEYVNLDSENPFRWTWIQPGQNLFGAVTDAARKADVAVVFVGTSEGEFIDRTNFALTGVQDDMIRAVAAANPHTVVVLNNGAPVQVSGWIDQVPGLVEAYYPGQAGGTALAAILFGDVNPSGKLVYTIGKSRKDYPDYPHYPARPGTLNLAEGEPSGPGIIDYSEGIYVGYRSFDKTNIQPSFPFGYGLSYTTFQYAHMKLSNPNMAPSDRLAVTADITNTGVRAGAEVVELYMKPDQPRVDRPIRELKGFARVELQPGETKPVSFHVTARDFAYCDVPGKQWKADAGTYSLELGSSSRDLRAKTEVQLTADYTESVPGVGAQPPDDAAPSLTIGKTVTASSAQDGFTPFKAIDGRRDSRWSSDFSDPQWLEVDLGEPTLFDHASILWEEAFAKAYQLQVSDDGKSWTTVYTNNSGNGGREKFSFPPVTARWVRILGTKRATGFGYSIFDFGLYPPQKK
jgi:beta-glucosidase